VVTWGVTATSACTTAYLPWTIGIPHDSDDKLALFPVAGVESNKVQLMAWNGAFLDEADAVRIGIFPAGPLD